MEKTNDLTAKSSSRLLGTYYYFFKDSPTAMAIADRWGIIEEANESFIELINSLSGTPIDLKNKSSRLDTSFDFLPIHDAIRFSNLLSKLAGGETGSMDFKTPYHDKDNNVHWFRIHAWKMNLDPRIDLSGRGNFIGFIMNDETIKTEAEEKLREDMKIAEKAMEAKSRFLAAMSHEIRTPIQTIIGMTELLEDTSLNQEQSEYSKQIKFSADVLLSLVNDILDYSKIEAGKMEVERIPFSPAKTIEQAAKMLSQESEKKKLSMILKIDPRANQSIMGDPGKFRQILINLIKNAIKFTAEGTITVSAVVALGDEHNRTITVSVADTGIGVPMEAQERLFTTFMQADFSHTRRFGGTGLGLAISRNMIELMGGSIEMVPNKEGGSIFRFSIPAEEAEEPVPSDLVVPADTYKNVPEVISLSGLKVMIAEDQPVNLQLYIMIMNKLGIQSIPAEDGVEALEKFELGPDIVLLDIQMPRMNGYETAAELRKRGFTGPLIAATASVLEDEKKCCWEAGFDDILPKPFKIIDIETILRKWAWRSNLVSQTDIARQPEDLFKAARNAGLISPVKKETVFCKEDLLDTFLQNIESAKSLLIRFLERGAAQIESLSSLAEEKNWKESYRIAHSIKGSSRTLSGMELGNIAAILEEAYKQADVPKIKEALPELTEAYNNFKIAAEDFIQS